MNLYEKIHDRWDSNTVLSINMPSERVFTGRVPPSTAMPYCSVTAPDIPGTGRTNSANQDSATIELAYWVESISEGDELRDAIVALFRNWDADMDDSYIRELSYDGTSFLPEEKAGEPIVYQYVTRFTAVIDTARTL